MPNPKSKNSDLFVPEVNALFSTNTSTTIRIATGGLNCLFKIASTTYFHLVVFRAAQDP